MRAATHRLLFSFALLLGLAGAGRAAAYDGVTPPALPDGDGGLAGLASKDIATLRRARDLLRPFATNHGVSWVLRRDAVKALARLHEALDDWGREGQLDFYLGALLDEKQGYVQLELAVNAQCAAKARQDHFGGVRAFWRKVDQLLANRGEELSSNMRRAREHLLQAERPLRSAADLDCRLKPLLLTVPKLNLKSVLRPYKVPKPPKGR